MTSSVDEKADKDSLVRPVFILKISAVLLIASLFHLSGNALAAPMTMKVIDRPASEKILLPTYIVLEGEVDEKVPERFSTFINKLPQSHYHVLINSRGGSLLAGLQLGRHIRKAELSISVGNYDSAARSISGGDCHSACALAFLGGKFRYSSSKSRLGVHRFYKTSGASSGDLDTAQILSAAVTSYIREMDVDPALFDLMVKAGSNDIYIVSRDEGRKLNVFNEGRLKPHWIIESAQGNTYLKGTQETQYGLSKAIFSCDSPQLMFYSIYQAGEERTNEIAKGAWHQVLYVDDEPIPLPQDTAMLVPVKDSLNAFFVVGPEVFRRVISAKRSVGHAMKPYPDSDLFVGYKLDIPPDASERIKSFLGICISKK